MRRTGIIAALLAALMLAGCVAQQSAEYETMVMAEPSVEAAPEPSVSAPKPIIRPKRRPDCLSGEGDGIGGTGCAIKIH